MARDAAYEVGNATQFSVYVSKSPEDDLTLPGDGLQREILQAWIADKPTLHEPAPTHDQAHTFYLSNGGHVTLYDGQTITYHTPMYATATESVVGEQAGEQHIIDMFDGAVNEGTIAAYSLHKRSLDPSTPDLGRSLPGFGDYAVRTYTNKYIVPFRNETGAFNPESLVLAALHRATNASFLGAGGVFYPRNQVTYARHQRVPHIREIYGGYMNPTALVDIRTNLPSDGTLKTMLRDTSPDAHTSPWAQFMDRGTGLLVAKMISNGIPPTISLNNEALLRLAWRTAYGDLSAPISGISSINAHESLIDRAHELAERGLLTAEDKIVVEEWKAVIAELKEGDIKKLSRRGVEWAVKKRAIHGAYGLPALDWTNEMLRAADPSRDDLEMLDQGHDLQKARHRSEIREGSAVRMRRTETWSAFRPTGAQIDDAKATPPASGQSARLGAYVQSYGSTAVDRNLNRQPKALVYGGHTLVLPTDGEPKTKRI